MKIGIFADSHYCNCEVRCNTRRPSLSLGKIHEAMEAFYREKVDCVICMGDLTDTEDNHEDELNRLREIKRVIFSYDVPFYLVPGNHDYSSFSGDELKNELGISLPPYSLSKEDKKWILLDANFRSSMIRYDVAGTEWTDSNLPPEQVEFLKKELETADKECVIFIHENLDNQVQINHIVKNADKIRAILENSKKVHLVLQGHYHPGAEHIINGIRYRTFPAMCEGEKNSYFILTI